MQNALPIRLRQVARWSALALVVSLTGCAGSSTAMKSGRLRGGGDPFLDRGVPSIMTVEHTEVSAKDAFESRATGPTAPKRVASDEGDSDEGDVEKAPVRRTPQARVGSKVIKFVGDR